MATKQKLALAQPVDSDQDQDAALLHMVQLRVEGRLKEVQDQLHAYVDRLSVYNFAFDGRGATRRVTWQTTIPSGLLALVKNLFVALSPNLDD